MLNINNHQGNAKLIYNKVPLQIATLNGWNNTKHWGGYGELEPLYIPSGNVKLFRKV